MNILQVTSNKAISRFAQQVGATVDGIGVKLPGGYYAYVTPSDKGATGVFSGPGVNAVSVDAYNSVAISERLVMAYYEYLPGIIKGALHDAASAASNITGARYVSTATNTITLSNKHGVEVHAQIDLPSGATGGYGATWSVYDPGSDEPAETDGIALDGNIEQFTVNLFITLAWKMEAAQ